MELQMCLENEQFSTLSSHQYLYSNYSNDSTNMETIQTVSATDMYEWEMDKEKELNGDLALIPELSVNSHESINKIIDSPPTVDFHRLMNEIQDYICVDPASILPIDESFIPSYHTNDDFILQEHGTLGDIFNLPVNSSFDLTQYLSEEDSKPQDKSEQNKISERKPRAGVKKIDVQAQKYIVDENEAIENNTDNDKTPTEVNDIPVLEACDLLSLLEQFEATEMPDLPQNFLEDSTNLNNTNQNVTIKTEKLENNGVVDHGMNSIKIEKPVKEIKDVKLETNVYVKKEIKQEPSVEEESVNAPLKQNKSVPHHPIKTEAETIKQTTLTVTSNGTTTHETQVDIFKETGPTVKSHKTTTRENDKSIAPQEILRNKTNTTKSSSTCVKEEPVQIQNRKVLNELPQDLISRIKESRKRKTISVIPPIPNKKRGGPKIQEVTPAAVNKLVKPDAISSVDLDHDYCHRASPEQVKKEPGSPSVEEDERAIIMKQPMVKNADGKLMVSLLKVNTIHSNDLSKKKKLGIEEYKRRREGKIKLQHSQSNSASSSSCSSPVPEDENTRILKHQEKLMKMAIEVLNSCPKSIKKDKPTVPLIPPTELQIPSNMEKKTFVSIGVNTEFKICKDLDPVMPVQQLEDLKPMLEKASDKFNENSLIKSVIENIPKVINNAMDIDTNKKDSNGEHGEDKTIVYLPKNRIPIASRDMEVQTNISLIQQTKEENCRRRRDSSSSSSSSSTSRHSKRSSRYTRRRQDSDSSSGSSRTSKSSYYNSRSHSASRSRSRSPPSRYSNYEQERIREVEERRVVYVGRISRSTTREHLRDRFQRFGPITNISLHFRDHGYLDNYGFVTFANQYAAFEAIEHANDDPYYPKYDLSFGGRRQFCITSYSDLDNMRDETTYHPVLSLTAKSSFDNLLRDAQEKLRRRKF